MIDVTPIILLWIVSAAMLLFLTGRLRRMIQLRKKLNLRQEEGTSYILGFVITVPIYLLLVLTILESTMLLMTKIATTYAAYGGCRSTVVWHQFDDDLEVERARQSVVNCLAPLVLSGDQIGSRAGNAPPNTYSHAVEYVAALQKFSGDTLRHRKLFEHYYRVAARTEIEREFVQKETLKTTVSVSYRAPLMVPGVARFLDQDGQYPYERVISSQVSMTVEMPQSASRTLGINYEPY